MQDQSPVRPHYEGLDVLRGLAALIVVCFHIDNFYPTFHVFTHGYLGVDLFFMLSGFVIAYVYEPRIVSGNLSFRSYLTLRLKRFYPLTILGVLLGAVFALSSGISPLSVILYAGAAAIMLPIPSSGATLFPLNTPQWSLFFELFINAIHAAVAPHLSIKRVVGITLISAGLYAAAMLYKNTASLGFGGGFGFVAGSFRVSYGFFTGWLIYHLSRGRAFEPPMLLGLAAWVFAVSGIIMAGVLAAQNKEHSAYADAICVFLIFPAVVWVSSKMRIHPAARPVAKWAGLISFPLYALQQPVIEAAALRMPKGLSARPIAWILLLAALCLAAWVIEMLYDAPLRRRIMKSRSLSREGVAATAP